MTAVAKAAAATETIAIDTAHPTSCRAMANGSAANTYGIIVLFCRTIVLIDVWTDATKKGVIFLNFFVFRRAISLRRTVQSTVPSGTRDDGLPYATASDALATRRVLHQTPPSPPPPPDPTHPPVRVCTVQTSCVRARTRRTSRARCWNTRLRVRHGLAEGVSLRGREIGKQPRPSPPRRRVFRFAHSPRCCVSMKIIIINLFLRSVVRPHAIHEKKK